MVTMTALFTGVGVALVTLFREDGALDAPATADLAGRLVDLGVRCVLVAGTTGEAAALTPDERDGVVGAVRAALPADVPVLAGTGAPTGRQAAELTERAFAVGADAVLALSPPGVAEAQVRLAAVDRTASAGFPAGYKRAAAQRFGTSLVTRVGR